MQRIGRWLARAAVCAAGVALAALAAAPARAAEPTGTQRLEAVLSNATGWLVGILAALATLFLTLGGVRHVLAGGDPGEVEKAKSAYKSAVLGYALAALAPVVVAIVRGILGIS